MDTANKQFESAVQAAAEQMTTPPQVLDQASRIDADYMAAVKRGDMETAQRMVDEAAKAAGYLFSGYHDFPVSFSNSSLNTSLNLVNTSCSIESTGSPVFFANMPVKYDRINLDSQMSTVV